MTKGEELPLPEETEMSAISSSKKTSIYVPNGFMGMNPSLGKNNPHPNTSNYLIHSSNTNTSSHKPEPSSHPHQVEDEIIPSLPPKTANESNVVGLISLESSKLSENCPIASALTIDEIDHNTGLTAAEREGLSVAISKLDSNVYENVIFPSSRLRSTRVDKKKKLPSAQPWLARVEYEEFLRKCNDIYDEKMNFKISKIEKMLQLPEAQKEIEAQITQNERRQKLKHMFYSKNCSSGSYTNLTFYETNKPDSMYSYLVELPNLSEEKDSPLGPTMDEINHKTGLTASEREDLEEAYDKMAKNVYERTGIPKGNFDAATDKAKEILAALDSRLTAKEVEEFRMKWQHIFSQRLHFLEEEDQKRGKKRILEAFLMTLMKFIQFILIFSIVSTIGQSSYATDYLFIIFFASGMFFTVFSVIPYWLYSHANRPIFICMFCLSLVYALYFSIFSIQEDLEIRTLTLSALFFIETSLTFRIFMTRIFPLQSDPSLPASIDCHPGTPAFVKQIPSRHHSIGRNIFFRRNQRPNEYDIKADLDLLAGATSTHKSDMFSEESNDNKNCISTIKDNDIKPTTSGVSHKRKDSGNNFSGEASYSQDHSYGGDNGVSDSGGGDYCCIVDNNDD